jgi:hypothetical protein
MDVVSITPLEASFWQRPGRAIAIGFSYTKASKVGQLNSDFNVRYRTPLRQVILEREQHRDVAGRPGHQTPRGPVTHLQSISSRALVRHRGGGSTDQRRARAGSARIGLAPAPDWISSRATTTR